MTVKELRQILETLDDNVEVKIGYAEQRNPIRFVMAESGGIILHSAVYMADPTEELVRTIATYGKFDKEDLNMKPEDKEMIIKQLDVINDIEDLSDGYHTYKSLYFQRLVLSAVIVNSHPEISWKSHRHEDGELCFGGGWFIVGIDTPEGQYTYHYEDEHWDMFKCKELDKAPQWDGHTDKDVERLLSI